MLGCDIEAKENRNSVLSSAGVALHRVTAQEMSGCWKLIWAQLTWGFSLAWLESARRKEEAFPNYTKVPRGVGGPGGIVNNKWGFWFGQLVAPYAETGNGSGPGEENNQCSFHLNSNKKHEVIFFKKQKLSLWKGRCFSQGHIFTKWWS